MHDRPTEESIMPTAFCVLLFKIFYQSIVPTGTSKMKPQKVSPIKKAAG